jgi:hypothetical protein
MDCGVEHPPKCFKGNGVIRKGTPVGEGNEGSLGRGGTRVKKQPTGNARET